LEFPRFYTFNRIELVRIGVGQSRITHISHERCDYLDEGGRTLYVDLEECARTWACLKGGLPDPDYDWSVHADSDPDFSTVDVSRHGCVGLRGAIDEPAWFQFLNRRRTQFEFKGGRDAIYAQLLTPLARAGWSSFDAC
jgi:hypothetical protein